MVTLLQIRKQMSKLFSVLGYFNISECMTEAESYINAYIKEEENERLEFLGLNFTIT